MKRNRKEFECEYIFMLKFFLYKYWVVSKVKPELTERGVIVSSGLLGGEGVTGVIIAIIKVLTMS